MAGHRESFGEYAARCAEEWSIRTAPLQPPDDPFLAFEDLVACSAKFRPWLDEHWRIGPFNQVLDLVRTAYRPDRSKRDRGYRILDAIHREFLDAGGKWDVAKQIYMPRNGPVLRDESQEYPQRRYVFKNIPKLGVTLTFYRRDSENVCYEVVCKEAPSGMVGNAILALEDAISGKEVGWEWINAGDGIDRHTVNRERVLSGAPHQARPDAIRTSSAAELPRGGRLRFSILFEGRRYESPVFRP